MEKDLEVPRTNRLLQAIGKRSNLVGVGAGFVGLLVSVDVLKRPLLTLAVTGVMYGVGFLLGADYRKPVSLHFENKSDRVEVASIQRNIESLRKQIKDHEGRFPAEMRSTLEDIFRALEDILPRWASMNSFKDQKFTVNQIVTDYLPTVLTNYLNLPDSLYYNSSKRQYRVEVQEQLNTLLRAVQDIREGVYKDMGELIERQSYFLRDKFGTQDSTLKP